MGDTDALPPLDSELSTITLTRRERVVVARCLAITAAGVEMAGESPRELLELHDRIRPEVRA